MSKFNKNVKPHVESPLTASKTVDGVTGNFAPAYSKDVKTELFLHAVGSFFGEDTFYLRDDIKALAAAVAVKDVEWLTDFVSWLRRDGNIRTASIVIALEGVHERLSQNLHGNNRRLIRAAFRRPDEPGEAVAYWVQNFGKNLPKPLKRAVADFLKGLNSYGFQKYGRKGSFLHRDLIRLTHPKPSEGNKELFKYILEKEDAVIPSDIRLRNQLLALPVADRQFVSADMLKEAGFTWEQYAGWLQGEIDWNKIIPSMGYMALLRNLRNFEEAGIESEYVRDKIADPEEVRNSKQLPFRFVSAYKELQGFYYTHAVETALNSSLLNVSALKGNTIILVDQSGSMNWEISKHSKMKYKETAALFGSVLAKRAENAHLWQFGTFSERIANVNKPVLRLVNEDFENMGATNTIDAVHRAMNGMPNADRIILITDEQASHTTNLPMGILIYVWNLVGYRPGHSGSNVHHIGGFNDNSFRIVQLLEAGKNADWPWAI